MATIVSHAVVRQTNLTPRALQYRVSRALTIGWRFPRIAGAPRRLHTHCQWYLVHVRQEWVLYLMILKPRRRNYVYLLDPVILPDHERYENWMAAINTIPEHVRKRIISLCFRPFLGIGARGGYDGLGSSAIPLPSDRRIVEAQRTKKSDAPTIA